MGWLSEGWLFDADCFPLVWPFFVVPLVADALLLPLVLWAFLDAKPASLAFGFRFELFTEATEAFTDRAAFVLAVAFERLLLAAPLSPVLWYCVKASVWQPPLMGEVGMQVKSWQRDVMT